MRPIACQFKSSPVFVLQESQGKVEEQAEDREISGHVPEAQPLAPSSHAKHVEDTFPLDGHTQVSARIWAHHGHAHILETHLVVLRKVGDGAGAQLVPVELVPARAGGVGEVLPREQSVSEAVRENVHHRGLGGPALVERVALRVLLVLKLVDHEGREPPLDVGDAVEPLPPHGNLVGQHHEAAAEEVEGHDQGHGRPGDLDVGGGGGHGQREHHCGKVECPQGEVEEDVGIDVILQVARPVDDRAEDEHGANAGDPFDDDLLQHVGQDAVARIVPFPQEHRPLLDEGGDVHGGGEDRRAHSNK
mmetsp:Transcript_6824/g.16691  ORF Transcript_6824/g.16691 Transcript_6824/m.16691 type:complete len:304 (-) Transcript_6824:702-1613(-)